MDFVYGLDDLMGTEELDNFSNTNNLPDKTLEWWDLAKQQLEAAAATLLGSFNKYAIIQNCCISTELLLKGALLAKGVDEELLSKEKKGYGHNLENLVHEIAELLPNMDKDSLLFAVQQLPNYVKSRYEAAQVSRQDLGNFLMNTQFISGETLRQFSNRNFRSDFSEKSDGLWNFDYRIFPKKMHLIK
ncbi:MAG: hypothetical protein HC881_22125 [Leptolyngbyaceae cyanobacterium SL_7_1]|nr:hypothetical protein [Leptolyngbyaceae cyanobacterium SL_7_1]